VVTEVLNHVRLAKGDILPYLAMGLDNEVKNIPTGQQEAKKQEIIQNRKNYIANAISYVETDVCVHQLWFCFVLFCSVFLKLFVIIVNAYSCSGKRAP
jgi:hypothetical protein